MTRRDKSAKKICRRSPRLAKNVGLIALYRYKSYVPRPGRPRWFLVGGLNPFWSILRYDRWGRPVFKPEKPAVDPKELSGAEESEHSCLEEEENPPASCSSEGEDSDHPWMMEPGPTRDNTRRQITSHQRRRSFRRVPRISRRSNVNPAMILNGRKCEVKSSIPVDNMPNIQSSSESNSHDNVRNSQQEETTDLSPIPRLRADGLRLCPRKPERYQAVLPKSESTSGTKIVHNKMVNERLIDEKKTSRGISLGMHVMSGAMEAKDTAVYERNKHQQPREILGVIKVVSGNDSCTSDYSVATETSVGRRSCSSISVVQESDDSSDDDPVLPDSPSAAIRAYRGLRLSPIKRKLFQVGSVKVSKSKNCGADMQSSGEKNGSCENDDECSMSCADDELCNQQMETDSLSSFKEGSLVWGRLGRMPFWPAITTTHGKIRKKPPRPGHVWVFWFGDRKVSVISESKLEPFASGFCTYYDEDIKRKMYKSGIGECLQVCVTRARDRGKLEDQSDMNLIAWAKSGFDEIPPDDLEQQGESIYELPFEYDLSDSCSSDEDDDEKDLYILKTREACMKKIHQGLVNIEDVCIVCCANVSVVCEHPLVKGGLCATCKMYCNICCRGGEMFVCSNDSCNRVYCFACTRVFVSAAAVQVILDQEEWYCFVCSEFSEDTHGLLQSNSDWQNRVVKLFTPKGLLMPSKVDSGEKRPIRVLSLFDGIGTGRYVLEKLGLQVDMYFGSEIDQDALIVSHVRHPDIVQLGDITELTWQKIESLAPIDLLIGGSPCNEISLANPARQGLEGGTGVLFFEFHRILHDMQNANKEHQLFWLFENVRPMPNKVKQTITRYLKCEPALWNARDFSAQVRARYFWGNIPRMYCPLIEKAKASELSDVLMPSRSQQVACVRTITTRSNSLMQGKDDNVYPVIGPDGHGDRMWTPELEQLFGFPAHHTDVGDLAPSKRKVLLGRAWSVPVISHLLSPLREFFTCKSKGQDDAKK